jgi:hypothetical protein
MVRRVTRQWTSRSPAHSLAWNIDVEITSPNVLMNERREAFVEGRLINVRRLVALDITLHGPRFITVEFGLGTPVILAIGIALILAGPLTLGVYLLLTGVNYVPLLVYTVVIVRGVLPRLKSLTTRRRTGTTCGSTVRSNSCSFSRWSSLGLQHRRS